MPLYTPASTTCTHPAMHPCFAHLKTHAIAACLATLTACASNAPPAPEVLPAGAVAIPLQNPSLNGDAQGRFAGWTLHEHMRGNSYTFVADATNAHSAPSSARIRRHGDEFFGLMQQLIPIPASWHGKTARFSGYLRTEGATGTGGALVIQARGSGGSPITHDHMDDHRVTGTQGWKRYSVEVKIPPGATDLQIGAMLQDDGTLWVDDVSLMLLN